MTAVAQFLRELDTGVAPMVGHGVSVELVNIDTPSERTAIENEVDALENQVELANCGLAVYLRSDIGGGAFVERGFYYRLTGGPKYQEMWPGTVALQRSDLLDLVNGPDELAIFSATPLGSERRIASPTGVSQPPPPFQVSGPAPSSLSFVGTKPNTANADIPLMFANWNPDAAINPFLWTGKDPNNVALPTPRSLLAIRIMQKRFGQYFPALPPDSFLHHEAPRRLKLTGTNLYEGAQLKFGVPLAGGGFQDVILPIYPTEEFVGTATDQSRVWETAVEFDALTLYALLFGGFESPGVQEALAGHEAAALSLLDTSAAQFRVSAKNVNSGYGTIQLLQLVY